MTGSAAEKETHPLLCDLDGTVSLADTTYELCLLFVKHRPVNEWINLVIWYFHGKAHLKTQLSRSVGAEFDVSTLPYNNRLIGSDIFHSAKTRALVSGAANDLVAQVAEHLGRFHWSQGTEHESNLVGHAKASYLQDRYPGGFAYVGDSAADLPVWQAATSAYATNVSSKTVKRARDNGIALNVLSTKPPRHQSLFKAMRFHQWVKNILIFAVPGLNILHFKPEWIITLLAGFVAFGLVASATYILNDLLDIQDDRKHPTKKHRVFARGALDIKTGLIGMFALAATGMAIGLMIGPMFALTILGYGLISTSYSLVFKKIAILDTIVLSFLFCWRVLAGAVIITVPVAPWFFCRDCVFLFQLGFGQAVHRTPPQRNTDTSRAIKRSERRSFGRSRIPDRRQARRSGFGHCWWCLLNDHRADLRFAVEKLDHRSRCQRIPRRLSIDGLDRPVLASGQSGRSP